MLQLEKAEREAPQAFTVPLGDPRRPRETSQLPTNIKLTSSCGFAENKPFPRSDQQSFILSVLAGTSTKPICDWRPLHSADRDTVSQEESGGFLTPLAIAIDSLGLRGARILVGVSGGADSVALLRGLRALAEPAQLQVVAAHLNHGMRPRAAEDDAEWTAQLCRRLDIPIVLEKVDVPAYANEHRLNIEEAARAVRYEFFERAAR